MEAAQSSSLPRDSSAGPSTQSLKLKLPQLGLVVKPLELPRQQGPARAPGLPHGRTTSPEWGSWGRGQDAPAAHNCQRRLEAGTIVEVPQGVGILPNIVNSLIAGFPKFLFSPTSFPSPVIFSLFNSQTP